MDILSNIDNPRQLEKLYRDNKTAFKTEFNKIYPQLADNKLAEYWNERLNYESTEISWGSNGELGFVIILSIIAAAIAKVPVILNINAEYYYQRNIGFIIFPVLTAYFAWRKGLTIKKLAPVGIVFLVSILFINFLPSDHKSNTLILSCIHLPLFLWGVLGFTYVGDNSGSYKHRLDFLSYNGDLAIMTVLILIAGAILTAITIGLFSVIGYDIKQFYLDYIAIAGLSAAPLVGTYLTQTNPQLVNKVSPVVAKIFSPLVLIMLSVYLAAILFSGKDPYNDREFLMVFNFLLIGVMAIILFSIAGTMKKNNSRTDSSILFALSLVTVIVNGIAVSAILFRIATFGLTPNRLAVLGGNMLMLINLMMVSFRLYKSVTKKADIDDVENAISMFLPVYVTWTIVVTFVFPFIFHFK